jgi:hypothetical protein
VPGFRIKYNKIPLSKQVWQVTKKNLYKFA